MKENEQKKLIRYLKKEISLLKIANNIDDEIILSSKKKTKRLLRGGNMKGGYVATHYTPEQQKLIQQYQSEVVREFAQQHNSEKIDLPKIYKQRTTNMENNKCSVLRTGLDGNPINKHTCYSKESLLLLSGFWNENHPNNKIESQDLPDKSIEDIHKLLNNKMKQYCPDGNEICWASQPWVKDKHIREFTFKPVIPKGKNEWLSSLDISFIMEQYQLAYFYYTFLGLYAIDFEHYHDDMRNFRIFNHIRPDDKIRMMGMVLNLDKHYEPGSHWVALMITFYQDKRIPTEFTYYDSTSCKGKKNCPPKEIKDFYRNVKQQLEEKHYQITNLLVNEIQTQNGNSECGMYSMRYKLHRIHFIDFKESCGRILDDESMNSRRKQYFRPDDSYDTAPEKHMPIWRYEQLS